MSDSGDPLDERLTTADLLGRMRLSRTTIWRRRKAGLLPRPIDRGRQCMYSAREIEAYSQRAPVRGGDMGRVNVPAIQARYTSKSRRLRDSDENR